MILISTSKKLSYSMAIILLQLKVSALEDEMTGGVW